MSNYPTIEGYWLTRLRVMTQFDQNNSARGKWSLLNSGKASRYAILKPGARTRRESGLAGQKMESMQTVIQVYQRYKDDGTSLTDLETLTEAIINELDTYPYIGDTGSSVVGAHIVEVREYQEILASDGGGPLWLLAELVGETNEETNVTLAE